MKKQKFERVLNGCKITIIVEPTNEKPNDFFNDKITKESEGLTLDGVCNQLFELPYTYNEQTWNKMLERRFLFAKKMYNGNSFTKEESEQLANLTSELSDYAGNYADGLFYEFIYELNKSGGLDAYRKINLTDEEKKQRRENAENILAKLRQKRTQL